MEERTPAQRMENVIRRYFSASNDADAAVIASCFHPEAVHYYPSPIRKLSGAAEIGHFFATRIPELEIFFTLDQLFTDIDRHAAAVEFTMFRRKPTPLVRRGLELYLFDPQNWVIKEIRGYSAAPLDSELPLQELLDFDYERRGYPKAFPPDQT